MIRTFVFSTPDAFHSQASKDFAEILLRCDPAQRSKILEDYGLKIVTIEQNFRVQHDGRKLGIGFFRSRSDSISFTINPKQDRLRLQSLLQGLGDQYHIGDRVRIENFDGRGQARQGEDDFSSIYLLHLLHAIEAYSRYFFVSQHQKKQTLVKGGVKGRPLLQRSLASMALGRSVGFYCEVLDDQSMRDYVAVLIGTAQSIVDYLDDWVALFPNPATRPASVLKQIVSRLGGKPSVDFSIGLLNRVVRPPFPFGAREILYKCLHYWQWKGAFALDQSGSRVLGYHGLVVQMDRLFEDYVRASWTASALGFTPMPSNSSVYTVEEDGQQIESMSLFFDVVLTQLQPPLRLVIDAKYKSKPPAPDDVYQVLSYLSYVFPNVVASERRYGILVYPADTWTMGTVSGFTWPLFLISMPVRPTLRHDEIKIFCEGIAARSEL